MLSLPSPVTLSAPEPVRTFSKLVMVSLPQPVFWAVSVARLTVTAVEPVKASVHAHAAVEGVVAEAALDDVGVGVTGQGVVVRAAGQVLDAAQGGDRQTADGGGAVRRAVQRGRDAGRDTREGRGVGPDPAVQQVDGAARVRARIERVVARAARKGVRVGVAREAVVEAGAQQVLEPAERVRARVAGVLRRALQGEADRHAGRGAGIGGGVVAAPPTSVSLPRPPSMMLSLPSPVRVSFRAEPTRFSMPGRVSMPAATVFWAAPCSVQVDGDARRACAAEGGRERRGVVAVAAGQRVVAERALEEVVALAAVRARCWCCWR